MRNVSLACPDGQECRIFIFAKQNGSLSFMPQVNFVNTTLRFQVIYVEADYYFKLDPTSNLDANGTGPMINQGQDDNFAAGGSYGGQGGRCDNISVDLTYGRPQDQPD